MVESVPFISPQLVRAARLTAAQTKRSVTEVLEDQSGLAAADFLKALGGALHYPVFTMDGLNGLTSAFEVVTFSEAVERQCVALRNGSDEIVVIMSDPFDAGLQTWLEH